MKTIVLKAVNYKGEECLLAMFEYDKELITLIKQVDGSAWSQTNKSWHVPNNEKTLKELLWVFNGIAFIDSTAVFENNEKDNVIPESEADLIPVKKLNTLRIEIIDYKKIVLRFPFAKEHIAKMKTIPYYYWHKAEKYWSFPYSKNILSEIESYFSKFNYQFKNKYTNTKGADKKEKKNYGNARKLPEEYFNKLKMVRYSENTVRTYTHAFSDFINYYIAKELYDITEKDIKNYLLYLIEKRKISASFQNQIINSIKFYYEKVLGGKRLPYITIDRPFKEKQLPTLT